MTGRISLQRALLGTVAIAILVGIVPAGVALDRRLGSELMTRARSDLEMAAGMIPGRGMPRSIDVLGRLTRSDVTILIGADRSLVATTLDTAVAAGVRRALPIFVTERAGAGDRRQRPHAAGGDRVARRR
jgi:hypothetical protein